MKGLHTLVSDSPLGASIPSVNEDRSVNYMGSGGLYFYNLETFSIKNHSFTLLHPAMLKYTACQ